MDTTNPAAPAGDGAQAADTSLESVLARRLQRLKEQPAEEPKTAEPPPEEPETPAADDPGQEPEPTVDAEQPEGDEPAEPEAEPEPQDFIPGNALTRMQDGSVRPVGELKKAWGELQEVRPKLAAAEARLTEVETEFNSRRQQLEQVLPLAVQAIESAIPPEPSDELWDTDPIEAGRQERMRSKALQNRERLRAEAERAEQDALQAYVRQEQARLLSKVPDLREPEKAKAFYGDYLAAAEAMGFTREEANASMDHRLVSGVVEIWRKARRFDEIEAAKAKIPTKTQNAVPVAAPGRRPAPGEHQKAQVRQLEQVAKQSRSIDDVLALRMARLSPKG